MPTGIADFERRALAATLAEIAARPGVDAETANRATWLRWWLEGFRPLPSYVDLWAHAPDATR
jgi:hypothetical protein